MILQCVESFTLAEMDEDEEETGHDFTVTAGTVWRADSSMDFWEETGNLHHVTQIDGFSLLVDLPFEYANCFIEDEEGLHD